MVSLDLNLLNRIVVSFGVPTIVAGLIYAGRKLQKLDDLDKVIEKEIRPDLQDVRERFAALEGKVTGYTASLSPIALTPKAENLLRESGFKEYIDTHKDALLQACKEKFTMDTAYDIQEAAFEYFDKLALEPELEKKLKQAVYEDGTSMEIVRRLGAIYFRDICLQHFNKDVAEIDQQITPVREP